MCCSVCCTCQILEAHGSDAPPSASLNPTQPSKASKEIYTYQLSSFQYQSGVLLATLALQSSHFSVPIIQEHSTAVIVLDKPPIPPPMPPILSLSNPDQRMLSPIYHRPRGPPYTTRTNNGTNYQASFTFFPSRSDSSAPQFSNLALSSPLFDD